MTTVDKLENAVSWHGSNHGDIKLSLRQYYDLIDPLLDERLSPKGLMKFKNLYYINSIGVFALPIVSFPFAYVASRWIGGPVHRGLGQKRWLWTALSVFWPVFTYTLAGVPIERKLYTDVLTDTGLDGTYVRNAVREKKPALWACISRAGVPIPRNERVQRRHGVPDRIRVFNGRLMIRHEDSAKPHFTCGHSTQSIDILKISTTFIYF